MGLGESRTFSQKKAGGGSGRSAEDYGVPDFTDEVLKELASNPGRYGEKSKLASREYAQRQGMYGEANAYRAALEKAAYGDAGDQYGQGLGQVANYLAGAGPLAYGGAGTALRRKLYSQIYGQARSRIGQSYADYLRQAMQGKRGFLYQKALQQQQFQNQKQLQGDFSNIFPAIAGGVAAAI